MLAAQSKEASSLLAPGAKSGQGSSWKELSEPVEPFLEAVGIRLAKEVEAFDPEVAPYADYALKGQGKHLRPVLVAHSASACGQIHEGHITAAVIIEMVHLATLVHDDVMDEAEIRRGRLTLAANWGNETAVLFGDCLFAQALSLAASFPTPEVCRAVALATKTVCSGEILQTQHRRDFQFTREKYFKVLEMKTAELFALSGELSAYLSGSSVEQRQTLRQFGLAFGTAYQLYDDCIDLFGCEKIAGKSLGTDLAKGKLTLPILLLWERVDVEEKEYLQGLIENWNVLSWKRLEGLLFKYDTLSISRGILQQYLEKARLLAASLADSTGRQGLIRLTRYLASQTESLGRDA